MGSGKTSIAKLIAKQTGYTFIDTDAWIEEREELSIPEIFDHYVEKYFRLLEKYCLQRITKLSGNYVIATGGGMSCNQHRLNLMLQKGKVIYLEIDAKSAINRLSQAKQQRPLLDGLSPDELEKKIKKLLEKRANYYTQAHHIVSSLEAKKLDWNQLVK